MLKGHYYQGGYCKSNFLLTNVHTHTPPVTVYTMTTPLSYLICVSITLKS